MKNFTYLIPLLLAVSLHSQNILWERSYGGRQADYLFDVLPTADYGFILAGSSLSDRTGTKLTTGNGDLDYYIWKMDEEGAPVWQHSFGGNGTDMLRSIRHTSDGGFILGGSSDSPAGKFKTGACRGGNDYWIIKLDAEGNEMWQKTIGGVGQDDLLSVLQTRDGGYIVGGSSSSGAVGPINKDGKIIGEKIHKSRGNMDFWIIKLDKQGNIEWQQTYGGRYSDILRAMQTTPDGGFILGGSSNSPQGGDKTGDSYGPDGDYWILKLDEKGMIEWQQTIGGEGDDQLYSLIPTKDNGYLAAGSSASDATGSKSKTNKKGTDFWVLKLDDRGYVSWQETYDFGQTDILTSAIENEDGTFFLGGYSLAPGSGDDGLNDFIALKISAEGDPLWDRSVGSGGEDILRKVIQTRDGGYIMAGTSDPEHRGYGIGSKSAKGGGKKPSVKVGSDDNIAIADNVQKAMDDAVNGAADKVNGFVDEKVGAVTDKVNDKIAKATGQKEDSRVKFGVNAPVGKLMDIGKGGGGGGLLDSAGESLANKGPKKGLGASRDKKTNYGNKDFWVVKFGEKETNKKQRASIEAFPNPAEQFTNIVIGFDFDKGSVSVFDLLGRQMGSFKITEQTIPINMGSYPEGIYIVSVTTNKGDASIKIIRK